jgi:hypothetical protein
MPAPNNVSISVILDWAVKVLSASMIPALIWIKDLEIQRAVHTEKIAGLEASISELKKENVTLREEITKSNAILPIILGAYQNSTKGNH